jgi:U3 small nucleolar RNA-associated protein 21
MAKQLLLGASGSVNHGAGQRHAAHDTVIVGLASDSCNKLLASVCQAGTLRTWGVKSAALVTTLPLAGGASALSMHAHSMLAAVACADLVVRVADVQQGCVVRQFRGHRDRLTAVTISADSKWVLSAALDGTLRVWDVPAATCLQVLALGAVVTSIALSPGMELLATAHVGQRGIALWSNRLLFGGAAAGVTPSTDVVDVRLPSVATGHLAADATSSHGADVANLDDFSVWGLGSSIDERFESSSDGGTDSDTMTLVAVGERDAEEVGMQAAYARIDGAGMPQPLEKGLVTLSGEAASKWESLVHLDAIKVRSLCTRAHFSFVT